MESANLTHGFKLPVQTSVRSRRVLSIASTVARSFLRYQCRHALTSLPPVPVLPSAHNCCCRQGCPPRWNRRMSSAMIRAEIPEARLQSPEPLSEPWCWRERWQPLKIANSPALWIGPSDDLQVGIEGACRFDGLQNGNYIPRGCPHILQSIHQFHHLGAF